MPWFKRPDGDLVKDETHVRRMIPYLMLGRNESVIYHDESYDLTKAKPWLFEYNRCHKQPVTLFHLFVWAIGTRFHNKPGLNRFVSGGRIYQRKGVYLTFAAKKRFREEEPLVTVKLGFPDPEEKFADCVKRILAAIDEGRNNEQRKVDKEVKLALSLPGWLLRVVMAAMRGLDRVNLLPGSLIEDDPMYTSMFIANLGSVGLDNTYHHLYEYGTASLFSVLGTPRKTMYVDEKTSEVKVKDAVQVRWTLDERINDGFYCALALRYLQRIVEDPEKYIGPPTTGADKDPNEKKSAVAAAPVAATAPTNGTNGSAKPATPPATPPTNNIAKS